ncbi:MAG: hypothetical protein SAK29_00290 [Scytonema sp. PMC 1069.18]|nr:hypothetical protein [Scytonema sp. PMC 1069.18]MEC4880241.1 hypothetical protein [Scytonema sp. PMC 1070.18]
MQSQIKAWFRRVLVATLSFITIFSLFQTQPVFAAVSDAQEVKGETCPSGQIYINLYDALQNRSELCSKMGQYDIARIGGGGSMDGPGYECKIRASDTRSLGNAWCKKLDIAVNVGDAKCPSGYSLATTQDVEPNQSTICNDSQVGPYYIMRLTRTGSMDGAGYQCKIRSEDTRALGHSLCVKNL